MKEKMIKKFVLKAIAIMAIVITIISLIKPQWFVAVTLTDTDNDGNPEYSVNNYSLRVLTPGGWTVYALDDYYGWVKCGGLYGPEVSSPLAILVYPFHSTIPREIEFEKTEDALKYKVEVGVSFHQPEAVFLEKEFNVQ